MVLKTSIKAYYREDRGGWIIYLPKTLVEDSSFPIKASDKLNARIEKNRVVIEKNS